MTNTMIRFPRYNGYGRQVGHYDYTSFDMYQCARNYVTETIVTIRRRREQGLDVEDWFTQLSIAWKQYRIYAPMHLKYKRKNIINIKTRKELQ